MNDLFDAGPPLEETDNPPNSIVDTTDNSGLSDLDHALADWAVTQGLALNTIPAELMKANQ